MQKAVNDVLDMKKRQWLFSSNYATDYYLYNKKRIMGGFAEIWNLFRVLTRIYQE